MAEQLGKIEEPQKLSQQNVVSDHHCYLVHSGGENDCWNLFVLLAIFHVHRHMSESRMKTNLLS